MNMLNRFTTWRRRRTLVHSQTKRTQREKWEKINKLKIGFSEGKSNLHRISFCIRSLFGLFILWQTNKGVEFRLSCVIRVIHTAGLQARPLIQHLAADRHPCETNFHCGLYSVMVLSACLVSVCVFLTSKARWNMLCLARSVVSFDSRNFSRLMRAVQSETCTH